jgi:F-type H+-transporting ATPase subunit c
MESMSRQPEMSGKIQTAMIVAAALIEGVALFGIVVAWLA